MKRFFSILHSAFFIFLLGCTTTIEGRKQVSPGALLAIQGITCGGAAGAVMVKPELKPALTQARDYLTTALSFTNASTVNIAEILKHLNGDDWIQPVVGLLANWSGDPVSARLILGAVRDGLSCAALPAARDARRVARVIVWQDAKREWRWTRYAGNNRKTATSGEGFSKRYALTSAEANNPGLPVTVLE